MHDGRPWRAYHTAVLFRLGDGERSLGGLKLRLELDQLQARQRAAENERAFSLEFCTLLRHHGLRLRHLRLARLVRQNGDDLALLHGHAAFHLEIGQHAAGARRHRDSFVGLGASRNRELAAVRNDVRHRHRDAERFLGLALGRGQARAALGSLVRKEVS